MTIKTQHRDLDWIAWIDGKASKFEIGDTEAEAIGKLIISRSKEFDIEIE